MESKIKVSVVMSVFNGENYLRRSIESILNQSLIELEFIIINDFSTDKSIEIINEYQQKDNRVVVINNSINLGLTKSLNIGLKLAKGEYIARIDADDLIYPDKLEYQYDYLEKHPDIYLLGTGTEEINEDGEVITIYPRITNSNLLKWRLGKKNCIYHSSIMFRNEKKYYYREKFPYSQDYDLYLCMLSDGKKLKNTSKILTQYRINTKAISWTKNAIQKLFAKKANEMYWMRKKLGKDNYDSFNSDDILHLDIGASIDPYILLMEIKSAYKTKNHPKLKELITRYNTVKKTMFNWQNIKYLFKK